MQGGSGTERHVDGMLDALRFGFEERPRLVHRLDKDTSGLLLIARTGQAAKRLAESFRDRETEKLYWAVVVGVPPRPEGAIDLPLAKRPGARDRETMQVDHEEGQKALTHFRTWTAPPAAPRCWRCGRAPAAPISFASIAPRSAARSWATASTAARKRCSRPSPIRVGFISHARRITLPHPSGKGSFASQAELPPHFRRTVEAFGFSIDGRLNENLGQCAFPGGG